MINISHAMYNNYTYEACLSCMKLQRGLAAEGKPNN
jgi:hypothetical protein